MYQPSMWPSSSPQDPGRPPLNRCLRLLPHLQVSSLEPRPSPIPTTHRSRSSAALLFIPEQQNQQQTIKFWQILPKHRLLLVRVMAHVLVKVLVCA